MFRASHCGGSGNLFNEYVFISMLSEVLLMQTFLGVFCG